MGLVSDLATGLLHPNWSNLFLVAFIFLLHKEIQFYCKKVKVPVVGVPFPGYIGSWFGAVWFVRYGHDVIRAAYESGRYTVFQVAMLERMLVVVTTKELMEEICYADPADLSFYQNIDTDFQVQYTMSREVHTHTWHIHYIHDQLTKKLNKSLDVMKDEMVNACALFLGSKKGATVKVNVTETFLDILTRLSNRYFVGKPLCRNLEYIHTAKEYAKDVAICGIIIRVWPNWLKPFAARLCSSIPKNQKVAMKYLAPIIEQRRDKMELLGKKWQDRPDDYLQWIMDGAVENFGNCSDTRDIMLRLMFLNFAGNHTSSETFCMVLYQLVNRPEYIKSLREEAVAMIEKYGYTALAFSMMSKLDSFIRECTRFVSLGPIIITRTAKIPYTLGNGISLPVGTQICMPHHSVHNNPNIPLYTDPNFDGFRFHNVRETMLKENPENKQAHRTELWTATSTQQLFFGNGRHPCPGRFFASTQSKMILTYLLTNYEMTTDSESKYEPHTWQTMYIPNVFANINFTRLTDTEPGVTEEIAFDLS
ncbi:hypothetical protein H072_2324 [Dactylellina haptotyla CBS 200.50]|uniref:Cytochrome P450 n=1 Tax=Dactylellina haptotyla (strain CBS 200.50) TaxID=1284197 RepID=S8AL99_DACHA|nr:hypothetical protein H072_2324 [Dactylellina haptotyla CBS 200.50]